MKQRIMRRPTLKRKRSLELQSKVMTSDGTSLFVRVIQQPSAMGKIPMILNDGLGCNGFAWKYLIDYFQHQHPIIHWHYRGHGHSDIPSQLDLVNIPQLASDTRTILDHLNVEKAIFCGHSMGVQVALEAFHQHPMRCEGLILLCGSFEYPLETWHASQKREAAPTLLNRAMKTIFPPIQQKALRLKSLIQPFWSTLLNTDIPYRMALLGSEVNRNLVKKEDFSPYFEHLSTMQAHVFMQMLKSYSEHSAKNVLTKIDKPTLIVCGGKDTFCPQWVALDMHHAIDNSELLFIPDGTHCAPIEHPELIHLRIEKFLWQLHRQSSNSLCNSIIATSMQEPASKRQKRTVGI